VRPQNGTTPGTSRAGDSISFGDAILNNAMLIVTNSTFSANYVQGVDLENGGGIANAVS
jgi:hypothetical protein